MLAFLRSLIARSPSGVQLAIPDAHMGLVNAIGATLPGACWQRSPTHYARALVPRAVRRAWIRPVGPAR